MDFIYSGAKIDKCGRAVKPQADQYHKSSLSPFRVCLSVFFNIEHRLIPSEPRQADF